MRLSIIIPVFNEKGTLPAILKKIADVALAGGLEKEVVIVDDFSDEKVALPDGHAGHPVSYKVIRHEENKGKGAAVRTGLSQVSGDFVLIQDADLEYDPADYDALLKPLLAGSADIVYGARFAKGRPTGMSLENYLANRFLTLLSNLATGMSISDMETCYKMMTRSLASSISSRLTSDRFGIEPEITALAAAALVIEVPVSYAGRTAKEGKKIGWSDGFEAIWKIIKFNFPFGHSKALRYLLAGACGAATNLLCIWFFVSILGVWYVASSIAAVLISYAVSFVLQKFWTFKDRRTDGMHRQAAAYFAIFLANLGINTALVFLFVERFGVNYLLSQAIAAVLIAIESFFAYQKFVFKGRSPSAQGDKAL